MSTVQERLVEFIKYTGIAKRKFETEVGIGAGSVNKMRDSINSSSVAKIKAKYPQLSTDWLMFGTGDMLLSELEPKEAVVEGIRERLLLFLESISIGQNAFERECGIGQGFVSRLNDNVRESSLNKIVEKYPQLNMHWLRTGDGSMIMSEDEQAEHEHNLRTYSERIIYVPLVGQYAHGGYLSGFSDEEYMRQLPVMPFIVERDARGKYVAFEVRGDSMDDGTRQSYAQGDIVLCREVELDRYVNAQLNFKHTDFVIVHNDGILIKRIIAHDVLNHKITVHSFNPIFDDMVIDLSDVRQIFSVILKQQQCRR